MQLLVRHAANHIIKLSRRGFKGHCSTQESTELFYSDHHMRPLMVEGLLPPEAPQYQGLVALCVSSLCFLSPEASIDPLPERSKDAGFR